MDKGYKVNAHKVNRKSTEIQVIAIPEPTHSHNMNISGFLSPSLAVWLPSKMHTWQSLTAPGVRVSGRSRPPPKEVVEGTPGAVLVHKICQRCSQSFQGPKQVINPR